MDKTDKTDKTDKLLEIKNLFVEYRTDEATVHAINGLDLELHPGEVLGLVGETGAGKTSLALSIMNLLPKRIGKVTQGQIFYKGVDITQARKSHMQQLRGEKISMIFQDPMSSLNPVMSVGDQIYEMLHLHHKELPHAEKNRRVDEIIKLVGIPPERKNEFPFQFSGGMKQRIIIAMSLVCEPELLIADEPTTALDVTIQAQILELMKVLKDQYNTAMIFITHNLGVVAEFCENVVVTYAGQAVEWGSVEEVFSKQKNHPYTRGLFECIPDLTSEVERLKPIDGYVIDPTNLPTGCYFQSRCRHRMPICSAVPPELTDVGAAVGTHKIKCHLFTAGKEESDRG